ncbi:MAG TPA: LuxR C-terminal-related transcriptional regulator [Thermoleophilaceae bacterium]|nr:LuxR C-terminal-related transcriptional regulator [Thermoleophilaceae bacterium]
MTSGWAGLFSTAFRRSQSAMALTDDERKIIDVNAAMAQLLGYRPSQLRGTHTWDHVADGPLMSREEWRHSIARGEVTGEGDVRCADGTLVRVQFAVHPEVVTGQRLVLFVGLALSRWGRHFRRPDADAGALGELSNREREVLSLVALGATSPEIASQLHISHNTVRKHVNSAMRKLGARSRAHLVAKALGEGQIER